MNLRKLCFCCALVSMLSLVALGQQSGAASDDKPGMKMPAPAATTPQGKVTPIESKKVCMVQNKAFDKDQIRVEVKGKVYYGCCDMCKKMLEDDPAQRAGIDPVSKKSVDKSEAVIAQDAAGNIFYFENAGNIEKYNATVAK